MFRSAKPQSIADVLSKTLKKMNLEAPLKKYSIWNYWEEIVGKQVATKAQPLRVQEKTLIVGVVSHTWMTELTHMKTMLLKRIQEKIEGCPIHNIRFELEKIALPSSRKK